MKNKDARAWYIFRRNYPAMAGGFVFIFLSLLSLFAVCLSPDDSPDAARQVPEAARVSPGTEWKFLLEKKRSVSTTSPLRYFFFGQESKFRWLPVSPGSELLLNSDTLSYTLITGERRITLLPNLLHAPDPELLFNALCLQKFGKPYYLKDRIYYWQEDSGFYMQNMRTSKSLFQSQHNRSFTWYLGSDAFGRDVFSRLLLGARVSILVGIVSVIISLSLGAVLGAIAAYSGGYIDKLIQWFISVVWSLPSLLLAIVLAFVLGKGFWQVFIATGFTLWVEVARVVRGQVLSLKEMNYIEAAHTLGYSHFRILFRHIMPNLNGSLIILSAANFASAILIESGLSFLGIGIQAPVPSWGNLIREGYTQIALSDGQWLAIFPGLAIVLLVVSLNLIGYGLRDAFDPRQQS